MDGLLLFFADKIIYKGIINYKSNINNEEAKEMQNAEILPY